MDRQFRQAYFTDFKNLHSKRARLLIVNSCRMNMSRPFWSIDRRLCSNWISLKRVRLAAKSGLLLLVILNLVLSNELIILMKLKQKLMKKKTCKIFFQHLKRWFLQLSSFLCFMCTNQVVLQVWLSLFMLDTQKILQQLTAC